MNAFPFGLNTLFNHDRRPIYMRDGKIIQYALDGKWFVYESTLYGACYGPRLFETDSAVSICAWLNAHEVSLQKVAA